MAHAQTLPGVVWGALDRVRGYVRCGDKDCTLAAAARTWAIDGMAAAVIIHVLVNWWRIVAAVALVAAVLWRLFGPPRPEIVDKKRRFYEALGKKKDATATDKAVWFTVYLLDCLAFSIVLPITAGVTAQWAASPYLAPVPSVIQAYLDTGAVSLFIPLELAALHWLVGFACVALLMHCEQTLMVPLFAPGVDVFILRSVIFDDERHDGWRFIYTQIIDVDPLHVAFDLVRIFLCELPALFLAVRTPIAALTAVEAFVPGAAPAFAAPPPPTGCCGFPAVASSPAPVVVVPPANFTGLVGPTPGPAIQGDAIGIEHLLANSPAWTQLFLLPVRALVPLAQPSLSSLGLRQHGEASSGLYWLYMLLFPTALGCFLAFPMQGLILSYSAPIAHFFAPIFGLSAFLFDADRDAALHTWLALRASSGRTGPNLFGDDGGGDGGGEAEPIDLDSLMPPVPFERKVTRRERWLPAEELPSCLRLRLAAFSVCFLGGALAVPVAAATGATVLASQITTGALDAAAVGACLAFAAWGLTAFAFVATAALWLPVLMIGLAVQWVVDSRVLVGVTEAVYRREFVLCNRVRPQPRLPQEPFSPRTTGDAVSHAPVGADASPDADGGAAAEAEPL